MQKTEVLKKSSLKATVDAALGLPKQQIFRLIIKLLRSMPLQLDDIPELEDLIDQANDCITEIEALGEDAVNEHPTIKVQVKPGYDRRGNFTRNYFYLRRHGKVTGAKCCGPILFRPKQLYQLVDRKTGEQRLLQCVRAYVSAQFNWEDLIQNPRCYLEMAWLNADRSIITTERFEFPACMSENFSDLDYKIEELRLPAPTHLPPAAEVAAGKQIDLSKAQICALTPAQMSSVVFAIESWAELSAWSSNGQWSVLKGPGQSLLIDGQQQELFSLHNSHLTLMRSPTQILERVEQMATSAAHQARTPIIWRNAAKKLLKATHKAKGEKGDRLLLTLFAVEVTV